ncbi:MAG: Fe3+/spermidine/putrescine ABC transporter ATP-binding protein [Anaerolineae bacterium]|nr:MAG: Fe3+/spermidine/putrescine ABC transporter ATP-binding protein [Anaerolineae bacterium]
MAFLEINNVSKYFGKTTAVKDFDLKVEKGELVSFLGPSGCGKTTTLRMVAGFEVPSEGQIIIDGKDMTFTPPNQRPVGMVFQAYALFPNMTVAGNIGFGLKIAKKPKEEIEQRVKEMLELIHMPGFENRYPHQLSGGQQQRVALARALAMHPEVLLLDEPLSALDAKIRVSLRAEIRAIQQELGITTIYVTHDQEEALSISDRVVVMNNARIEQVGTPFQIYNFPQTEFVAQFVGTLNAVLAEIVDVKDGLLRFDGQQVHTADKLEGYRNGDRIMVAIRPERLSFAHEGRKANILTGTIKNITFLGSIVRIQVKLGESVFYMDTFNNPYLTLPNIGDPTEITCSKEAVLVLQQQPA